MLDRPTKLQEYQTYIDGKWCSAASGKRFESYDPYTGEPWALIPECDASDVDRAVEAAYARLRDRTLAGHDADGTRQDHAQDRRADREAWRAPRQDRGARQRQADLGDGGAAQVPAGVVLLLRRAGRQNPGRGGAGRSPGPLQLHPEGARGRVRVHHAVELAPDARGLEAGAGAGGRLHRGDQAVRVHLGLAARVHEAGDRGSRACRPAWSTS